MPVEKTTSPLASTAAPKDVPVNREPSSRTSIGMICRYCSTQIFFVNVWQSGFPRKGGSRCSPLFALLATGNFVRVSVV